MFDQDVYNIIFTVLAGIVLFAAYVGFVEQIRVALGHHKYSRAKLVWFMLSNLVMTPLVNVSMWQFKPWRAFPYRTDDGSILIYGLVILIYATSCLISPMLLWYQAQEFFRSRPKRPS